jgi:adenylate kinase
MLMVNMIISISGTPGVGKTSIAKILKKELDANLILLNALPVPHAYDKKRRTKIVAISDLQKAAKKKIKKGRLNIIDGHLSHLMVADMTVILRCRPDILEKRMKKKGWKKGKIIENIQTEILDSTTIEALGTKRKIIEIDTTKKSPKQVAMLIKKVLNSHALQKKYLPGRIDWTRKFSHYLINYPAGD